MNVSELLEAFTIFARYDPDGPVSVTWDRIWTCSDDLADVMAPEEFERLKELGWFTGEESFFRMV